MNIEQAALNFDGPTFDKERDSRRLGAQLSRVKDVMIDGEWRTLQRIAELAYPASESSVSARLRDLRKPRFGGYVVNRRHVAAGIFEYQVQSKD